MRFTMKSPAAAAALLVAATRALEIRSAGEEPNNMAFSAKAAQQPTWPTRIKLDAPDPSKSLKMPGSSNSSEHLHEDIQQLQQMHSVRLEREKEVYAKKIQDQEIANAAVEKENHKLTKDVKQVKDTNSKLLRKAGLIQKDISVRRHEVALLTEQLMNSANLMSNSFSKSDLAEIKELDVLRKLGLASTDAEKTKFTALLSISQVGEGDELLPSLPKDIVNDVSSFSQEQDSEVQEAVAAADAQEKSVMANILKGVQKMRKQGKKREEQLKIKFLSRKAALDKIHKADAARNAELKATLSAQTSYATRLIAAIKKMQEVTARLDTQLKDGGLFMKRLADVTERKPKIAVKQLEAVSKMVGK